MRYLYGDSSPSPLQSNYLAFFRDAMEFCVQLLLAQERITALREERAALDRYADAERSRIAGLKALVVDAANEANHDGAESISLTAVKRVISATEQAITSVLDEQLKKLEADRAALAAKDRRERDDCLDSFGKWVALHEAHEGAWRLSASLDDTGHYQGETSGSAPYGAEWRCAIELDSEHPMAAGIRVGDLVTQIELALPEASGWLKKGKLKAQRIDQYSIDSFTTDGKDVSYELRAVPNGPLGVDVAIRGIEVEVTVAGAKEATAIEVNQDNRERLLTLRDRILEALTVHAGVRRRVVTATIEGQPLADGDDLGLVVKRMIDTAAPIVKQIRKHSMSPHELVIRRLLGNDRREEIFVSTASLLEKLGRLPRGLRSMFAPLGLEWQRARTPVPGEIFVEPPREVVAEPPSEKLAESESVPEEIDEAPSAPEMIVELGSPPEASGKAEPEVSVNAELEIIQAVKAELEVIQAVPKPAPPPSEPAVGSSEGAATSIEAALLRSSSPSIETPVAASSMTSTITIEAHTKDALAATVKRIVGVAREGRTPEAYAAYAALFDDKGFAQQRPQDQRQVLKLVLMSKSPPPPSESVTHAYRSALARLKVLSAEGQDPIDDQMIGMCLALLG